MINAVLARQVVSDKLGLIKSLYLIFLLTLLTGALQRPLGGGSLEGSMTGIVIESDNPFFKALMLGALGTTSLLMVAGVRHLKLSSKIIPALSFIIFAFFSVFWSYSPESTIQGAAGIAFPALVVIFAYSFFSWPDARNAIVIVMIGVIWITGILALFLPNYAFHSSDEFFSRHVDLLRGTFVHKNNLGVALTLALLSILSFGRYVVGKGFWIASIALATHLIFLTDSAKSFVSVPLAIILGIIATKIEYSAKVITLLLALLLISIFLFYIIGIGDLVASVAEAIGRDPTLSGRTEIWRAAIEYTNRSGQWLLGGSFEAAWNSGIGQYSQTEIGFNARHPHNGFIAVYLDLGLVGLSLIAFSVIGIFKESLSNRAEDKGINRFMISMLVLLLVTNLAGTTLAVPVSMSWFFFVLLPLIPKWSQRSIERNP